MPDFDQIAKHGDRIGTVRVAMKLIKAAPLLSRPVTLEYLPAEETSL